MAKLDFNILLKKIRAIPLELSLWNHRQLSIGLYKARKKNKNVFWIIKVRN